MLPSLLMRAGLAAEADESSAPLAMRLFFTAKQHERFCFAPLARTADDMSRRVRFPAAARAYG